jgi:hypothetical protein
LESNSSMGAYYRLTARHATGTAAASAQTPNSAKIFPIGTTSYHPNAEKPAEKRRRGLLGRRRPWLVFPAKSQSSQFAAAAETW